MRLTYGAARSPSWARHYQHVWLERTANARLPMWLRVSFLAFGSHQANGHARFKPGEVALVLGRVDPVSGEIKPQDKSNVQRAIRGAVEAGWLAEGSSSLCLVVPAHAVAGGLGNENAPCSLHTKERALRSSTSTARGVAA